MHVVLDTNVLVSGLLTSGLCRKIITALKKETFSLVLSEALLEEIIFVIHRPKFRLLVIPEEKEELITFIKSRALLVEPKEKVGVCRDPQDNKILECAVSSPIRPKYIVTGDQDLLTLKYFRHIPIIKPRDFLISIETTRSRLTGS